ncbi:A/G-specific adenine glycosylase [Alkalibacterium iburiense]|uniref:Adenine DNA glycosylase n=1 Tax=Alkalibacterium iburiense TaxID=290589 RepID=A0ABP3GS08_9LACT
MSHKNILAKHNIQLWPKDKIEAFRKRLLNWYDQNKRDLPWRRTSNPYYIWVSEIMLQQTQVDTVIPYYNRFIKTLPTIHDLAQASEETLLKLWEGLGYYSRVRNMKTAAIQIVEKHEGVFPRDKKDVLALKGIGPYTAGAVTSIAFNQAEPAVDGNVMRVMSRLFEIELDIGKASSRKVFEALIYELIDPDRPGDFNQALMDLGATICTPNNYFPETSPVKEFNASYINETWERYPIKKSTKKVKNFTYYTLAIKNERGEHLFEKRPSKGVLAGMWTYLMIDADDLPNEKWKSFENQSDESLIEDLENLALEMYGVKIKLNKQLKGQVSHIFSHLKWNLLVYEGDVVTEGVGIKETTWIHPESFDSIAFPVPTQKVRKLLTEITLF